MRPGTEALNTLNWHDTRIFSRIGDWPYSEVVSLWESENQASVTQAFHLPHKHTDNYKPLFGFIAETLFFSLQAKGNESSLFA